MTISQKIETMPASTKYKVCWKPLRKGVALKEILMCDEGGVCVRTAKRELVPCPAEYAKNLLIAFAKVDKAERLAPLPFSYGGELQHIDADFYRNPKEYAPFAWFNRLDGCRGDEFVVELLKLDLWKWDENKANELAARYLVNDNAPRKNIDTPNVDAAEIEGER